LGGHLRVPLYLTRFSTNGSGTSTWMIRFGVTQPYTLVVKMFPRWMYDTIFKAGIRAVIQLDRCGEESERLESEIEAFRSDGLQTGLIYSTKHGMSQQVRYRADYWS
jgi:hypothetical protein